MRLDHPAESVLRDPVYGVSWEYDEQDEDIHLRTVHHCLENYRVTDFVAT
jgi:hypothetical protein